MMSDYCYFKFRAVDKNLIDSLVRSTLYFAPRAKLNDPFDSSVDIERAIQRAIDDSNDENTTALKALKSDQSFLEGFEQVVDAIGICSFSLTLKETLMWSHYADNHAGVAIRYEFSEAYLNSEARFLGNSRASYVANPISSWLRENAHNWNAEPSFAGSLAKKLLVAKAPAWEYEDETRVMRSQIGSFQIPRSTIKSVVFGLRTSSDDKELVRSIVEKYYDGVTFGYAVRTQDDFGIAFEECQSD